MSFDARLNSLNDIALSFSKVDANCENFEFQKSLIITSLDKLLSHVSMETKIKKFDKASVMLSKILKLTCQLEILSYFEGVICRRIGCILHQQNKLDQAIRMYFRNVEVSRKIDDLIGESEAYGDIALCLYALKNYKDSLLIYNMQVELNVKSNDELTLYKAKSNLGLTLAKLGRLNEAEDTLKLCVEYFKIKEDIYNLANSYARLAQCYHISGKWRGAKMSYNLCLDACIRLGDPLLIAMARLNFALYLHNDGKYQEAIEVFRMAEKILTASKQISPLIAVVYSYAARSAFMLKDYSLAINRANLAIDHFTMSRSKITPQEEEASFEEEREAYTWLCLSQIYCRKLIDAVVSTEKCRQLVFEKSIKRVVRNSITHSICNRKSVVRALRQINSPIFMFQMIRLSSTTTYLILWLILPATKSTRIKIICKPTVLSSHGIIDVRQWVSHCRLKLGFKGWQWNDESTRVNVFPVTYEATALNPLLHSLSREDLRRTPPPHVPSDKDGEGKESGATKPSQFWSQLVLYLVRNIGILVIIPASVVFVRITSIISFLLEVIYYINGLPPPKGLSDKIMSTTTRMTEPSESGPKELTETEGGESADQPDTGGSAGSGGGGGGRIDRSIKGGDAKEESLAAENDNHVEHGNSDTHRKVTEVPVTSSAVWNNGSMFSAREERSHIVRNLVSKYKCRRNRSRRRLTQATLICRELYEVFFRPFEQFMAQFVEGQQLLVVSHDVLSLLPYSAMLDSNGDYLVEKYKIKLLPSISLTSRLMERERDKFIWRNDLSASAATSSSSSTATVATVATSVNVFQQRTFQLTRSPYLAGKSIFSFFPKLCQVDREIGRIKDLFMDQKILCSVVDDRGPTKQDISYALRHSSIFHLATHGTRSGYLIISGDETDDPDTFLTITDIYDLYNRKGELTPDLVILNACLAVTDSVLMDNMDSYVMALLSCGTSCVITTIGDIEDIGAEEIMVHFYSSLLGTAESDVCSKNFPLDCVEALQAATLKLMTTEDYQDKPNLWATYIAVGLGVDLRGPIF